MKKTSISLMPSVGMIIFCVVFLSFLFPGQRSLLDDSDTGWHIRIGDFVLENFSIPRYDIFSYVTPPLPWTVAEWASEVIMALLHRAFGLNGVVLFFAFLITSIYYFLFKIMRRNEGNIVIDMIIILLVVLSSSLNWHARPHVFSLLFFLIFYYILETYDTTHKNYLFLFLPLMLCWVNLHGGFIIGFVLISVYLVSNTMILFLSSPNIHKDNLKKIKTLGLILMGCLCISLLNPSGYHTLLYSIKVISNKYLMDHIQEFMSPDFHQSSMMPFKYLLLFLILLLAGRKQQVKFSEILVILFFTGMALTSARYILFFDIAIAPILSRYGKSVMNDSHFRWAALIENRARVYAAVDSSAKGYLWVIPVMAITPALLMGKIEQKFNDQKKPVAAVEFVKSVPINGNMFNDYAFGGYMIYAAYPQYRVFIHGKTDWRAENKLREYAEIKEPGKRWKPLVEKYKINWIIIKTESIFSTFLEQRQDWRMIYTDKVASIFVRNVPENFVLIKTYGNRLSNVPLKATGSL